MYINLVKVFEEETILLLNILDFKSFKGKISIISAQIYREAAELSYGLL